MADESNVPERQYMLEVEGFATTRYRVGPIVGLESTVRAKRRFKAAGYLVSQHALLPVDAAFHRLEEDAFVGNES
jgi:hypothetical protein